MCKSAFRMRTLVDEAELHWAIFDIALSGSIDSTYFWNNHNIGIIFSSSRSGRMEGMLIVPVSTGLVLLY